MRKLASLLRFIFFISFLSFLNAQKYTGTDLVNIPIAIKNSKKESGRQVILLAQQTGATALESQNQGEWTKFNEITGKIQIRLSFISTLIKGAIEGKNFISDMKEIRKNQREILEEINTSPENIKELLPQQIGYEKELNKIYKLAVAIVADQIAGKAIDKLGEELSNKINDLEFLGIIAEIAGETMRLATSVADGITSMESADRKMLVDIVIKKVENLRIQSAQMLETVRIFKMAKKAEEYKFYYTNNDKQIMESVMAEYKDKF